MRILIVIPLLIILVAFALSNQQVVRVGLWPTDLLIDLPLSLAVLAAAGLTFVVGAFITWGGALQLRARARRAEANVRRLEAQVQALRAAPGTTGSTGPAPPGQAVAMGPRQGVLSPPG